MMSVVSSVGLPGVPVTDRTEDYFGRTDRNGDPLSFPDHGARRQRLFAGGWYGRLAAASIDRLVEVVSFWRPDIVVGGRLDYAAPLVAYYLGVPFVRQAVDMGEWSEVDEGATEELQPELKNIGLTELPTPDLPIEIYPPSLRPKNAPPAELMRWRPGNVQRTVERWMVVRGTRPRVCVTPGSRATPEEHFDYVRYLVETIGGLDVELIVAVPDSLATALNAVAENARVGWAPLDVIAPTCDLFVHHAGGMTSLTALDSGVPQLIMPEEDATYELGERVSDLGAAITLPRSAATAEKIQDSCSDLVSDTSYRTRAEELAVEIKDLTPPTEMVPVMEKLVG
ncbi:DUF1205 domain-containing protein [Halostreptopolyspora alba]|uniref:DUF1205 domain-containing protein n=2 Tax=Halostreptopolyspora alba TaxID=2487137 RepID=A0A3N0EFF9_9ACTN|nr:DUF1205 domain-containing protein [Nocardiopsaceae bacterium YIM 96095]